jgi:hypothetical protein
VETRPDFYFLRRARITSKEPETKAIALPAEPIPISGTLGAFAVAPPDTPTTNNIIPRSLCTNPLSDPSTSCLTIQVESVLVKV